jgi:biopolymer transport protein ExbB/TolQ
MPIHTLRRRMIDDMTLRNLSPAAQRSYLHAVTKRGGLKEGKQIADASLMKLFRAAEALRQEADPKATAMDRALKDLRCLKEKVGGRNKLAKVIGVTGPYIGRVLKGEKPMTEELELELELPRFDGRVGA